MAKNIEINYKNEGGYEVLYPNVQTASVLDIGNFYYNKTEVDEKIQDNKDYVDGLSFKKTLVCNQAHFDLAEGFNITRIATRINFTNVVGFEAKIDNFYASWNRSNTVLRVGTESGVITQFFTVFEGDSNSGSISNFHSPIIIWLSKYACPYNNTHNYCLVTSSESDLKFNNYTNNNMFIAGSVTGGSFSGDITLYLLIY